jgi:hypothetical protein
MGSAARIGRAADFVLFMGLFVVTGAFNPAVYGDRAVQRLAHGGFSFSVPNNLALATATLSNLTNNSAARWPN